MAKVKKRYVCRPEGCIPGKGCLTCCLPDCVFTGRIFPEEHKMLACGGLTSGKGRHPHRKGVHKFEYKRMQKIYPGNGPWSDPGAGGLRDGKDT